MANQTGRAGAAAVNATTIKITKWSCKVTKEYAKSTDSGNYVAGTGQLYGSQLGGETYLEGSIEGNYDSVTTNANFSAGVENDGPWPTVLKYTPSASAFSGNFDFTDVETSLEVPGATMVTFTANFKSNGQYLRF